VLKNALNCVLFRAILVMKKHVEAKTRRMDLVRFLSLPQGSLEDLNLCREAPSFRAVVCSVVLELSIPINRSAKRAKLTVRIEQPLRKLNKVFGQLIEHCRRHVLLILAHSTQPCLLKGSGSDRQDVVPV
jgi:hypothetical protein